ncbi:site-specific DNA-methyltransferase [Pseudoalteromonas sp. S3173]|uniref:site-specific DNA-methyltransferase n=1 Tax=Pseudoalteromonas sp. S3173 TaxID=579531 RepID=UPI00110CC3D9|nr:site-specific DNA-methyltransferase [Pseudoalteromonas sp. S3173]TMS61769.1 site-specific DNA-methyltransferase [Pseudoalteromonas sp. S3173]
MNKITTSSTESKSKDLITEFREQLFDILPECNIDGQLDVERLVSMFNADFDSSKERFGFNWSGKNSAINLALKPSNATLRPDESSSVNWNDSENIFIEGDNLEAIKLLQKSYHKQVKMIYIDPPYNTGKDFIYSDSFKDSVSNYLSQTKQLSESGKKVSTNIETSGRYHSNWLSMIYPRLKLARNLLKDDGVIVIHLDENENYHLRIIMNEIYGEDNFIGEICWDKGNPKGDSTKIAYQHESILVFAKNINVFKDTCSVSRPKENAEKMLTKAKQIFSKLGGKSIPSELKKLDKKYELALDLSHFSKEFTLEDINSEFKDWVNKQSYLSGGEAAYNKIDRNGDVYRTVSMAWPNKKQAPDSYFIPLTHPVTGLACPVPDRGWRNPPETMKSLQDQDLIVFGDDENKQPERKYLLKENLYENVPSILKFAGSDDALLKKLGVTFDNPKPVNFAKKLISYFTNANDIVLDFFAGSGTTGHAVLKFSEGEQRKFILIQLPEPIGNGKVISDITKERLSKVENVFDKGFKCFKLDETNIRPWDADFDNLELVLQQATESIKEDRSSEDVLYEIFLKYGYELTTPVDTEIVNGKTVFVVGAGALIVCLDDEITGETVEGIAKLKEKLDPETTQVVFKDAGFADSNVKTNAIQILKQAGIDDVKSI